MHFKFLSIDFQLPNAVVPWFKTVIRSRTKPSLTKTVIFQGAISNKVIENKNIWNTTLTVIHVD